MASENNVRVYTVADQSTGALQQLQRQSGLDPLSLGGYISIIVATHLTMMRRPQTSAELDALVRNLTSSLSATLPDQCARLVAMIKRRRLNYYKEHRRDFVPESVDEARKGDGSDNCSGNPKELGKYSDRLRLSRYMAGPLAEADISYALTQMMGFASGSVAVLRTVKPEPPVFSKATSTGFKGTEEQRTAAIQQRAFVGSTVFVETARVREAGYVDVHGGVSVLERADGTPTTYDVGCGLVTHCLPLQTHLHNSQSGLELDAALKQQPYCAPFIVDVSSASLPSSNGSDYSTAPGDGAVFTFDGARTGARIGAGTPTGAGTYEGQGHHVVAVPLLLAGKKILIVFESRYRSATFKTEGLVFPQERILAEALNFSADGRRFPLEDHMVNPGAFTHRRCKLCQVVHASDMHSEFQ
jgi:hypothetical protein